MEGLYDDRYLDDYYGDHVSAGDKSQDGDQEQVVKLDLWDDCIVPTTGDAFRELLIPVLVGNLVLKLVHGIVHLYRRCSPSSEPYGKDSCMTPTIVIGMGLLGYHLRDSFHLFCVFLIVSLLGTACVVFATRHPTEKSPLNDVWKFCGLLIIMNEIAQFRLSPTHIKMRPHLMLLLMKLVSICDDIERRGRARKKDDQEEVPPPIKLDVLSILSYVYHPGSILLGSWHPAFSYLITGTNWSSGTRTLFQVVGNLSFSLVSLSLSNCLIQFLAVNLVEQHFLFTIYDYLPNDIAVIIHKLTIAYFVALQFRTSHYFIAKLTQASFVFWGNDNPVTNPWSIESPRSLVDVVVSWNVPMHIWLKKYVFKPAKDEAIHPFYPIMVTYIVSSFLHGFNFQIWSVLLTLGCLTFLEFETRAKLTAIYDSCLLTRSCQVSSSGRCLDGHTNDHKFFTWLVNGFFKILAFLHLAYLGSTFDGKEDSAKLQNVLSVWSELGFYSHLLAIINLIVYIIIPSVQN